MVVRVRGVFPLPMGIEREDRCLRSRNCFLPSRRRRRSGVRGPSLRRRRSGYSKVGDEKLRELGQPTGQESLVSPRVACVDV